MVWNFLYESSGWPKSINTCILKWLLFNHRPFSETFSELSREICACINFGLCPIKQPPWQEPPLIDQELSARSWYSDVMSRIHSSHSFRSFLTANGVRPRCSWITIAMVENCHNKAQQRTTMLENYFCSAHSKVCKRTKIYHKLHFLLHNTWLTGYNDHR